MSRRTYTVGDPACGRERERMERDIPLLARDTDNDSARTLVTRPNVR